MSDETPKTQANETKVNENRSAKSWRDDPLSVFLIVAAVVLAVMYAWDQWQLSQLEEQMARAEAIGQSFAVDGANCEVTSAGQGGETLVLSCPGLEAEKIAVFASDIDAVAEGAGHFEEVWLRGADGQLRCTVDVGGWPEACKSK